VLELIGDPFDRGALADRETIERSLATSEPPGSKAD